MRGKYASHNFFSIYSFLLFSPLPFSVYSQLFTLQKSIQDIKIMHQYVHQTLGCHCQCFPWYKMIDIPSHSKYTIFGIFCRTIHGSRDAETYDFSCVSWINNAIIPKPCCGVIRTSFFLICFHNLCLESFLFFLVPLHYIMQSVC